MKAVKQKVGEIPVFAAGGVFSRKDIDEICRAGAAGAQIATRFIATDECDASQGYKDVILAAGEEDDTGAHPAPELHELHRDL